MHRLTALAKSPTIMEINDIEDSSLIGQNKYIKNVNYFMMD